MKKLGFSWMFCLTLLNLPVARAGDRSNPPPLQSFQSLDPSRYLGHWYEIASIPQFFQKDCTGTQATYSQKADGEFQVFNQCFKENLSGSLKSITGTAWIPNPQKPAEWKVRFFWPFKSDYWILEVGQGYEYAVVGEPTRTKLWILSRTPNLSEDLYEKILKNLQEKHFYNIHLLQKTLQPLPNRS